MPYSVEMFFDEAADAGVRAVWQALTAAGIPSLQARGTRPHISLAVADSLDVPGVCQLLDRFAVATAPFPLSFASLGFFPGAESVVFLAPKVMPELLALHARFCADFVALTDGFWPHYLPASWVPHCTLAVSVRPAQLPALSEIRLPITATVSAMALIESPPVRELHRATF